LKKNLHPEYKKCIVSCACGSTFETRSTVEKIHVEICSQCHPFYTGKQKLVDSAGRVELFNRRYRKIRKKTETAGKAKAEPSAEPVAATEAESAGGDRDQSGKES